MPRCVCESLPAMPVFAACLRKTLRGAVLHWQARAIVHFERVHPWQQRGNMWRRDRPVDPGRHVVQRREELSVLQIWHQLANVVPQALDLSMLTLVQTKHIEMNLDAILREHAGHLACRR